MAVLLKDLSESEKAVIKGKVAEFRRNVDTLRRIALALPPSRSASLAATKLEEAGMWLGKYLGELGFTGHEECCTHVEPIE